MPRRTKIRADVLLAQRGLAESRERAQAMIMAGLVFAPSGRIAKPGALLDGNATIEVRGRLPYVSRGGLKLEYALNQFRLDPRGLTALDVGASTGGFTDCLLQRGAARVYAIDVGRGQLAYPLRQNPRVVGIEKRNARYPFPLPEAVDLAVIDVSFISLCLILPAALEHLRPGQPAVALVKPQFEAAKGQVGRGGIVRDPQIHAAAIGKVALWAIAQGLRVRGICRAPIRGDSGNAEFFILLQKGRQPSQNRLS